MKQRVVGLALILAAINDSMSDYKIFPRRRFDLRKYYMPKKSVSAYSGHKTDFHRQKTYNIEYHYKHQPPNNNYRNIR
ncbi:MAG: hypothetical protein ABIB43_05955 [archaeon]